MRAYDSWNYGNLIGSSIYTFISYYLAIVLRATYSYYYEQGRSSN